MIETTSLKELAQRGLRKVSIACGNFDGLHKGHQAIINKLIQVSRESQSIPVVLTFHPHPREVLTGVKVQNLTSNKTKLNLLKSLGVEALVTAPFSKEFAAIEAEDFVNSFLLENELELCNLCIGSDWKFGKGRLGDVDFLSQKRWPFTVHPVSEVNDESGVISSSRIRQALREGDFELAKSLLGRDYSVSGKVIKGKGIAQSQLNFPTANIEISDMYMPLAGVYTCIVGVEGSKDEHYAVCNIGFAPTFYENAAGPANLEVHLLDFSQDLYGLTLDVTFTSFLRKEKKFNSAKQLKEQIGKDVLAAKTHFKIS